MYRQILNMPFRVKMNTTSIKFEPEGQQLMSESITN